MGIIGNTTNSDNEVGKRTKRIASNSIVLFLRIFLITIINLYAVRYILKGLGDYDYGIFNAVAGFVLMGAFFIPVLAVSIQRFYSFAIGRGDMERFQQIYAASMNMILLLEIVLLLIFETIGLWFVNTHMNIDGQEQAANVVFQLAIFSFMFSLLQIPSTAAIFAHEDMGIYALVSTLECLLKFIVALLIAYAPASRLVFYSSGLLVVAVLLFCSYVLISRLRYPECRYRHVTDKGIYKELFSFSGWTMYGAIAGTGMIQGSTLLLNVFFGPVANAAFAVANNIYNAFNSVTNSIVLSFRPAMVQSYAEGKNEYLNTLFNLNSKFILYLLTCISLPIIFEMDDILQMWLGEMSDEKVLFARLFVIYSVCLAMHHPITTIVQSIGRIREYHLYVESITILNIPVAYILFKCQLPSYSIFISMIGLCAFAHVVRLFCLRRIYPVFSIGQYVKTLILPGMMVIVVSSIVTYLVHSSVELAWMRFVLVFLLSSLCTIAMTLLIGITKAERTILLNIVGGVYRRKMNRSK